MLALYYFVGMNFAPLIDFSREQRRGMLLVAAAAIALSLFYMSLAHGHTLTTAGQSSSEKVIDPLASQVAAPSPSVPAVVVVDVAGKVLHPGVYSLSVGSRAVDAIKAAGGAKSGIDLSDINLAEILTDGEQILVGAQNSSLVAPSKGKKPVRKSHFPIHINTASADQFDLLPGIGPVMAQRILDYRKNNGAFSSIDDLRKVKGMGSAKFGEIKSMIVL